MAKATMKVTRRDGKVTLNDLKKIKPALVKVGVLSGTGRHPSSNSANLAEIAAYIEYGTEGSGGRRGINEYAPFRRWLLDKKEEYRGVIRDSIEEYIKGEIPFRKVLQILGRTGASDLQKTMKDMVTPENEESTQLKKGSKTGVPGARINNPTIDTGLLRQSISWGEA